MWRLDFLPPGELTGQQAPAARMDLGSPCPLRKSVFPRPPLYFEFHERGFTQAARIGDWKAVRLGTQQPIELYELKTDVSEQRDVAAHHPEIVRQFAEYLNSARTESELWPVKEPVAKSVGSAKRKASD